MRAASRMSVDREINQNVVKAFAEVRLLNRQIAAQAVAVRMAFAGRVMAMRIRSGIVVMIAASVC
jgi:hypothetical protein